ncbi:hypothetical protein VNI00_005266 [Paramarasmius palmivorus]|uniref:Uncharacterized protein n=1 Tax=Paramarasmius palmivorus TaxID=297713 RepID=A0AAW0DDJ8_9AGAR
MYEGEHAQAAWEEDFRQFSRMGRNLDVAQLFAINQSDIPMLIFHRGEPFLWIQSAYLNNTTPELIPLAHFYTESFWMQLYIAHLLVSRFKAPYCSVLILPTFAQKNNGVHECNLWMDASNGILQRGPKGPSVAYSRPWTDDSIVVPSTVDMLKAETTITFFRKFGRGIDNVVLRHAALHRRTRTLGQLSLDLHDEDTVIVGQKFQASNFWRRVPHQQLLRGIAWLRFDTIYSPSLDAIARWSHGSESLWKCTLCVGLSDMKLVERDTIRFRLNDTQEDMISLQFEYDWRLFQEAWLSQSTRVLDASMEDNYFCTNPPLTLGFETIRRCRYRKDAPTIYLFIRLPTTISELNSWKEVQPYFWSLDMNGQTRMMDKVTDRTKWRFPKLHSYFRRDQRVALQSWPNSTYNAIRDWQKAQGFDPSTSDWARSMDFPEMDIIGMEGGEEGFELVEEIIGASEDWEVNMEQPPPSYNAVPTYYDETHHGKWYMTPEVASLGNAANLMGYLPHHSGDTDGSFAICLAGGNCTLVSKRLYESIPTEHRPPLDTTKADLSVSFMTGGSQKVIGSTIVPIVLTDEETGQRFCIKLYALVMENLLMGMFIGEGGINFIEAGSWGRGKIEYDMDFGNGKRAKVVYRMR